MEWHFYRNGYQGFLSYILFTAGWRTIEKLVVFFLVSYRKANHTQRNSQTPPGLLILLTTREETTELYIKMGKEKVVRLCLAFLRRQRAKERAICRDRVNFLELWFFFRSVLVGRLALPFVDVGRKEIITSKIDALRPKSRALFGFFSGFLTSQRIYIHNNKKKKKKK